MGDDENVRSFQLDHAMQSWDKVQPHLRAAYETHLPSHENGWFWLPSAFCKGFLKPWLRITDREGHVLGFVSKDNVKAIGKRWPHTKTTKCLWHVSDLKRSMHEAAVAEADEEKHAANAVEQFRASLERASNEDRVQEWQQHECCAEQHPPHAGFTYLRTQRKGRSNVAKTEECAEEDVYYRDTRCTAFTRFEDANARQSYTLVLDQLCFLRQVLLTVPAQRTYCALVEDKSRELTAFVYMDLDWKTEDLDDMGDATVQAVIDSVRETIAHVAQNDPNALLLANEVLVLRASRKTSDGLQWRHSFHVHFPYVLFANVREQLLFFTLLKHRHAEASRVIDGAVYNSRPFRLPFNSKVGGQPLRLDEGLTKLSDMARFESVKNLWVCELAMPHPRPPIAAFQVGPSTKLAPERGIVFGMPPVSTEPKHGFPEMSEWKGAVREYVEDRGLTVAWGGGSRLMYQVAKSMAAPTMKRPATHAEVRGAFTRYFAVTSDAELQLLYRTIASAYLNGTPPCTSEVYPPSHATGNLVRFALDIDGTDPRAELVQVLLESMRRRFPRECSSHVWLVQSQRPLSSSKFSGHIVWEWLHLTPCQCEELADALSREDGAKGIDSGIYRRSLRMVACDKYSRQQATVEGRVLEPVSVWEFDEENEVWREEQCSFRNMTQEQVVQVIQRLSIHISAEHLLDWKIPDPEEKHDEEPAAESSGQETLTVVEAQRILEDAIEQHEHIDQSPGWRGDLKVVLWKKGLYMATCRRVNVFCTLGKRTHRQPGKVFWLLIPQGRQVVQRCLHSDCHSAVNRYHHHHHHHHPH